MEGDVLTFIIWLIAFAAVGTALIIFIDSKMR